MHFEPPASPGAIRPAVGTRRRELDLSLLDPSVGILSPEDEGPATRSALEAWLQLQATLGLRPQEALEGLRRHQSPERALAASRWQPQLSTRGLEMARRALIHCGARALPILAAAYPARLRVQVDAAPLLLAIGAALDEPALFERPSVAIVGARAATAYGLRVARDLARELASQGVVVVSGLARGIDGSAHAGALEAGGVTVAVQACGPDRVYPPEHRLLANRIREQGLLLTEMPPGTPPRGPYFPLRNRIIAAIARVVVVVEARERSGSLITARHALDRGSEVMAVPGQIRSPTSAGPNALLDAGARPVRSACDVLEELGLLAHREAEASPGPPASRSEGAPVDPDQRALLDVLRQAPASRDELVRTARWSAKELALQLIALELDGRVVLDRDGRYWLAEAGEGRGPTT